MSEYVEYEVDRINRSGLGILELREQRHRAVEKFKPTDYKDDKGAKLIGSLLTQVADVFVKRVLPTDVRFHLVETREVTRDPYSRSIVAERMKTLIAEGARGWIMQLPPNPVDASYEALPLHRRPMFDSHFRYTRKSRQQTTSQYAMPRTVALTSTGVLVDCSIARGDETADVRHVYDDIDFRGVRSNSGIEDHKIQWMPERPHFEWWVDRVMESAGVMLS